MQKIPLAKYVLTNGQTKTAAELGMYQSAISKAIKQNRTVNVIINDDGSIEAEEIRPFPSSNKRLVEGNNTSQLASQ